MLFALTGGPGAGKTTLVAELGRRGFAVARESGRAVVLDHPEFAIADRSPDQRRRFAALVLERDRRTLDWARNQPGLVVFDRSPVDGADASPEGRALAATMRFAAPVARLPVWPAIFTTDEQRRWSLADARAIEALVVKNHRALGHPLLTVPPGSVGERADWLLARWSAVVDGSAPRGYADRDTTPKDRGCEY